MRFLPPALLALTLAGFTSCANPINLRNAEKYYGAALDATAKGNHSHAVTLFSRAYGNASMGNAPDAGLAMTLYGYGRELALVGDFDEGIERLEESLRIQRSVEPKTVPEILRRTNVLGRIYLDRNQPDKAFPYLAEARELVASSGIELADAEIHYLLVDLERATAAAGTQDELAEVQQAIATLRGSGSDLTKHYPYERFTQEAVDQRLRTDLSPQLYKQD